MSLDTHHFKMPSGKHQGELITRVPVSYLKWMVCVDHSHAKYAQAEMDRRGTVTPEIDISGHAIDSASLRVLGLWNKTRQDQEGLNAWLCRLGQEALRDGEEVDGKIHYAGMRWVFQMDGKWPVLKTIMTDKRKDKQS